MLSPFVPRHFLPWSEKAPFFFSFVSLCVCSGLLLFPLASSLLLFSSLDLPCLVLSISPMPPFVYGLLPPFGNFSTIFSCSSLFFFWFCARSCPTFFCLSWRWALLSFSTCSPTPMSQFLFDRLLPLPYGLVSMFSTSPSLRIAFLPCLLFWMRLLSFFRFFHRCVLLLLLPLPRRRPPCAFCILAL